MTPNTFVPYVRSGETLDGDYNSWQEGKDGASGKPTYAMITSRSYHAGIVQSAMVDGSVQSFANETVTSCLAGSSDAGRSRNDRGIVCTTFYVALSHCARINVGKMSASTTNPQNGPAYPTHTAASRTMIDCTQCRTAA